MLLHLLGQALCQLWAEPLQLLQLRGVGEGDGACLECIICILIRIHPLRVSFSSQIERFLDPFEEKGVCAGLVVVRHDGRWTEANKFGRPENIAKTRHALHSNMQKQTASSADFENADFLDAITRSDGRVHTERSEKDKRETT